MTLSARTADVSGSTDDAKTQAHGYEVLLKALLVDYPARVGDVG